MANVLSDNQFTCENHHENLLFALSQCRRKEMFCDVVLLTKSDGKRLSVHRLVLYSTCEYFKIMFDTKSFHEYSQHEVPINDVDGDTLCVIVEYLYTGKILITDENAQSVLQSAHLFQIIPLVNACAKYLSNRLSLDNCLQGIKLANMYGCSNLLESATDFVIENFLEVICHEEFPLLDAKELIYLLRFNFQCTETLFAALNKWILHDVSTRKPQAVKLLQLIQTPLLKNLSCAKIVNDFEKYCKQNDRKQSQTGCEKRLMILSECSHLRVESYNEKVNLLELVNMKSFISKTKVVCGDQKVITFNADDSHWTLSEYFDISSQLWVELPQLVQVKWSLSNLEAMTMHKNKVFKVGGCDGHYTFNNHCEVFNLDTLTTEKLASMKYERADASVGVSQGKLYVFGSRKSNCGEIGRSVECYCPNANGWTSCAPMPVHGYSAKVVRFNGCLYLLGGFGQDHCEKYDVLQFDPCFNNWRTLASLPDHAGILKAAGVYQNKIVAICSTFTDGDYESTIFAFDLLANRWKKFGFYKGPGDVTAVFSVNMVV